jgi:hypothetical protein
LLILLATGACTDLDAVRDYANTASTVTANAPVYRQWPDAYDNAEKLAGMLYMRRAEPQLQERLRRLAANTVVPAKVASQATDALALYLTTLAQLADDKVPDVSQQGAAIKAGLTKLGVSGTGLVVNDAASQLVNVVLDAVRQRAIADLIANANNDVKTIASYLADAAGAIIDANDAARSVTYDYWDKGIAATHDIGTAMLLYREQLTDDSSFAGLDAKAKAAQSAFTKIGQAQQLLYENRDRLRDAAVRKELLKNVPVLIDAIKSFQKA